MKCFGKFLSTDENSNALFLVRLSLWVVIFAHWAQKLFGWFWGWGFLNTLSAFTEMMWIPLVVAVLVILWESLWALALIMWFFTRFMAFWIFIIMFWAAWMFHLDHWFFIDWMGSWQEGQWIEMHILALWMALALMLEWGWRFSLDTFIKNYLK